MLPQLKRFTKPVAMAIRETTIGLTSMGSEVPTALVLALVVVSALFAWTTPNHYPPWLSFHSEFAMAISTALAGALVL